MAEKVTIPLSHRCSITIWKHIKDVEVLHDAPILLRDMTLNALAVSGRSIVVRSDMFSQDSVRCKRYSASRHACVHVNIKTACQSGYINELCISTCRL